MDNSELELRLADWSKEGLVTDAQAVAIREREAAAARRGPLGGGIPVVTEILGYVGGALAAGALLILMFKWWDELGAAGRVALPGLVAVAAYVAGFAIGRVKSPSACRLEQFLLLLGVAATAFATGLVVHDACCSHAPTDPERMRAIAWSNLTGFVVASAAGALVYRLRRTPLQHMALGFAIGGTVLGVQPLLGAPVPAWLPGVALVLASLAWGALSLRGRLPPVDGGLALASVGILLGIVVAGASGGGDPPRFTAVAGLAASLGLLAASLALKRGVPLAFGALGGVIFVPWLLSDIFGPSIGVPIAVLLTGVVLVAMAVMVAVVVPRFRRQGA